MAYNIFLSDEDGYYILDESGDRIIVGVGAGYDLNETVLNEWRRIGGVVRRDVRYVNSFTITRGSDDRWRLTVNQTQMIGLYPSQEAAIAVLIGLITRNSGGNNVAWVEAHINNMLSKGSTSFIEVADNALRLERDVNDYVVTLSEYVPQSILPADGTRYVALQYSDTNGVFADSGTFTDLAGIKDVTSDAVIDGDDRTYTFVNGYTGQLEDTSARTVIIDMDGSFNWVITNVKGSPEILKDEVKTLLSVGLNPSEDATLSGETPRTFNAFHTGSAVDVVYTWTVAGDTTNVTSATSATGSTYILTWDEITGEDETVEVSVSGTSVNAGVTLSSGVTEITLDQAAVPAFLAFGVEVSGASAAGTDVNVGGQAFAVVTDTSTNASPVFTHEWFKEIPDLSGITLTPDNGA